MTSSYHLEDKKKSVPKLRFKGYNDEWVEYRLEEKGIFLKGSSISKNDISLTGQPCILYGELYTRYNEVVTKIFSKIDTQNKKLVVSKANDVLIPSSGETAIDISTATCVLEDNIILGSDLNIFRPLDCDGCFISYSINHKNRKNIAKLAQGATIFHLYSHFLKKTKVRIPSLPEQQKIASFLTLIDKKIEKQKELVELLKKYKRGLLSQIFSQKLRFKDNNGNDYPVWKEKRLGDICKIVGGGTPDTNKSEYWGDDINWFTPTEITKKYSSNSNRKISKLGLLKSSAKILPVGTVLLTTRATLGEMAILTNEATTNQGFQSLIPNKKEVQSEFIYYCQPIIKPYCYKYANGSTFLEISKHTLLKLKLVIPNIDEQNKITTFMTKYDDKIKQEENILNYLMKYKNGLLQQLFI